MAKELEKKEAFDVTIFEGASDTGFEGTDSSTFKTPFMKVLQAMSPELKKSDPKYIPNAEQGKFCNSATGQIYDFIDVVVLKVEHSLISWRPDRGGFAGRVNKSHELDVVAQKEGLKKWDSDGNSVMDTIEFFCLNIDDPSDIFILPLSGASYKHGRSWATRLRMLKANNKPVNVSWAGVWRIKVVEESNDKGSWYTIGGSPEFVRFITKEEKENFVVPAKDMLSTAETDYSAIDQTTEQSETEF